MNVALLYPEVYELARFKEARKEFPPLGVLNLAAAIERDGHLVKVFPVSPGEAGIDLSGFQAVGFSLSSSATVGVMRAARFDSLIDRSALVMVGGIHASLYPEQALDDFAADVACIGQCEEIIGAVLAAGPRRDFRGIPGAVWLGGVGLHRQPVARPPRSLDGVPLPARHLLPAEELVVTGGRPGTGRRITHVAFSRGCAFTCAFCAAGRTQVRYRSGPDARRELISLIEVYGIEGFAIVEDNFTIDRTAVIDISTSIAGSGPGLVRAVPDGHRRSGSPGGHGGAPGVHRVEVRDGVRQPPHAGGHGQTHHPGPDPSGRALDRRRRDRREGVHRPRIPRRERRQHAGDHRRPPIARDGDLPGVAVPVRAPARITGLRTRQPVRRARDPPTPRVGRRLVEIPHPPQRPSLVGHPPRLAGSAGLLPAAEGVRGDPLEHPE